MSVGHREDQRYHDVEQGAGLIQRRVRITSKMVTGAAAPVTAEPFTASTSGVVLTAERSDGVADDLDAMRPPNSGLGNWLFAVGFDPGKRGNQHHQLAQVGQHTAHR